MFLFAALGEMSEQMDISSNKTEIYELLKETVLNITP